MHILFIMYKSSCTIKDNVVIYFLLRCDVKKYNIDSIQLYLILQWQSGAKEDVCREHYLYFFLK